MYTGRKPLEVPTFIEDQWLVGYRALVPQDIRSYADARGITGNQYMYDVQKLEQGGVRYHGIGERISGGVLKKEEIYQFAHTFVGSKKWSELIHDDCEYIRKFWEDNNPEQGAIHLGGDRVGYISSRQDGESNYAKIFQR